MNRSAGSRPGARAMLSHPWVAEGGAANDGRSLEPEVLLRLKRFAAAGRLQQAALKVCLPGNEAGS
jgi:hypothetical protein